MPRYKFSRGNELTTEVEVLEMIKAARDAWVACLVAVLYLYGCRISEALQLRKEDVTLEKERLVLQLPIMKRRVTSGPYARPRHLLEVLRNAAFVEEMIVPYL